MNFCVNLDSEKLKRSRKETNSPKTDLSETSSDSCADLKKKDIVKQEASNEVCSYTF